MGSKSLKISLFVFVVLFVNGLARADLRHAQEKVGKAAHPFALRCNYRVNPMGIETLTPNFSWQIATHEQNWLQSAYQIVVATTPEALTEKNYNVWNSGKTNGGESVSITYDGPALKARQRYYWKLRVWDQNNKVSVWSEPASWEMGIMDKNDFAAHWIAPGRDDTGEKRKNIKWIWLSDQEATKVPRNTLATFRLKLNFKELPVIAAMHTAVRGNYTLIVNGKMVDVKEKAWQAFERQDILQYLKIGSNTVDVKISAERTASFKQNTGERLPGRYAAFAGLLSLELKDGTSLNYPTSCGKWFAKSKEQKGWQQAKIAGELNDPNFGLDPGPLSKPVAMMRKDFPLKRKVKSARLYISALGSYRAFINGKRIGNDEFTPEFTNYHKRLSYQTYDVTLLLNKGKNTIASFLADGWYGSPLSWHGEYDIFGSGPNMLLAELHIVYKNGTSEKIISDGTWKTERSPILKSEIYSGEYYDARLEQSAWNSTGFDDNTWKQVQVIDYGYEHLSAQETTPVRLTKQIKPTEIKKAGEQRWIIDMGQNLVGRVKLKMKGTEGKVVKLRFAEILSSPESLYVENLRAATSTDSYVMKGNTEEEYTPAFTFHGFRYVELIGYPGELTSKDIVAEAISSVENPTAYIETSSELLNKMYELGIWGQRGNFISIPTDCPQRDERLGYTGDGQVFWRTGSYNFDIASFTHKWMSDIRDEQTPDGSFTNTAPAVPKNNQKNGSPGWEDAGIIVPWTSWQQYGDKSIISENWEAMERYMDHVERKSNKYIRPGGFLGDWLAPDITTPNNLIATGLWGMTAKMMAQMAKATGKEEEADKYWALNEKIRAAFQQTFIADDGTVGSGSQTSYVIALHTGMIPSELKATVVEKLVKAIEDRNWHVSTGFMGTPYVLFALSDNGRADVAYRLLQNETFPSWGYMIKNGATTWWERWNSDTGDPKMNSFNHYAFGSVVEWMYRAMIGINTLPEKPGFKEIIISPVFDTVGKITAAKGRYQSVYGEIVSEWRFETKDTLKLKVKIPANTRAKIILPANAVANESNGATRFEIGSGVHTYTIAVKVTTKSL